MLFICAQRMITRYLCRRLLDEFPYPSHLLPCTLWTSSDNFVGKYQQIYDNNSNISCLNNDTQYWFKPWSELCSLFSEVIYECFDFI